MLQETSQRLNVAWQQLLAEVIEDGVAAGCVHRAPTRTASAWRILSLLDGLALQTVAHRVDVDRARGARLVDGVRRAELGLPEGALG